ncbi:hypothetical protein BJ944DRAFT_259961 [Cunninghamella echinulata]|nr:hypothetical protein BJ944DRAFT_259961 [Cunninghamella echinulata]
MKQYPVRLNITKAKGRHAVALEDISEGTTVCLEQATAFIVRSDYMDQQCHICLDDLSTKMACSDCKMVYYCSQKCIEMDEHHHQVCSLLSQITTIGRSTDVDPDLLRLMVYLLLRKKIEKEDENNNINPRTATPYWCVEELLSHKEKAAPAFIKVISNAAERILVENPNLASSANVDDLVTLACRINSNAHGLGDNHSRNTDVALGLFPIGAMFFNHSCNPNTAFIGLENGKLAFRTIRPVRKDEELVVSYIDIYAPRDERRQNLLNSKHFWCKCKRCTATMDSSVDRFLNGIVCKTCQQDVYVIPPSTIDDIMKQQSILNSVQQVACAKCGDQTSAKNITNIINAAEEKYMRGMTYIRRDRNYRKAKIELESFMQPHSADKNSNKYSIQIKPEALHPLNALRFNAYIPLMNCLRYEKNTKDAINVNKLILDYMLDQTRYHLPENTSEISDFWQNLGELYDTVAKEYRLSNRGPLEKKWNEEARDTFLKAANIRSIVFGPVHPKTKYVKKYIKQSSC